jgi:hypothetical protein
VSDRPQSRNDQSRREAHRSSRDPRSDLWDPGVDSVACYAIPHPEAGKMVEAHSALALLWPLLADTRSLSGSNEPKLRLIVGLGSVAFRAPGRTGEGRPLYPAARAVRALHCWSDRRSAEPARSLESDRVRQLRTSHRSGDFSLLLRFALNQQLAQGSGDGLLGAVFIPRESRRGVDLKAVVTLVWGDPQVDS